ncbi:unnamed protein product [Eruca vesicaria subsp. sativa]|uniref:Transmembrane protein n=1 Tax=Eruca vesicaria subsp. sativa TaxID=29727 RepID=A0ABC8KC73_ERUVS|nr:unnamed protein product [Eruca vesicaria subsp. sativa]
MGFRRTSLVLYILFIYYLQHSLIFMSSLPPSADTNHESVPSSASESDVVGYEGKTQELAFVN